MNDLERLLTQINETKEKERRQKTVQSYLKKTFPIDKEKTEKYTQKKEVKTKKILKLLQKYDYTELAKKQPKTYPPYPRKQYETVEEYLIFYSTTPNYHTQRHIFENQNYDYNFLELAKLVNFFDKIISNFSKTEHFGQIKLSSTVKGMPISTTLNTLLPIIFDFRDFFSSYLFVKSEAQHIWELDFNYFLEEKKDFTLDIDNENKGCYDCLEIEEIVKYEEGKQKKEKTLSSSKNVRMGDFAKNFQIHLFNLGLFKNNTLKGKGIVKEFAFLFDFMGIMAEYETTSFDKKEKYQKIKDWIKAFELAQKKLSSIKKLEN